MLCEKEGGHNNRQLCKKRLVCGEEEYEYGSGVKGRGRRKKRRKRRRGKRMRRESVSMRLVRR